MKEAIEKAIANGFDVEKASLGISRDAHDDEDIIYYPSGKDHQGYYVIDLHRLIFGTPFIDALLGKYLGCKNKKCEGYSKTRDDKFHIHDHCKSGFKRPGMQCEGDSRGEGGFIGTRPAPYHLHKMSDPAISRDIDKLKDYVRGLI